MWAKVSFRYQVLMWEVDKRYTTTKFNLPSCVFELKAPSVCGTLNLTLLVETPI